MLILINQEIILYDQCKDLQFHNFCAFLLFIIIHFERVCEYEEQIRAKFTSKILGVRYTTLNSVNIVYSFT